jgi:hypothetical protein
MQQVAHALGRRSLRHKQRTADKDEKRREERYACPDMNA